MILITGGMGFVGANTAAALLDSGEEVVVTRHQNVQVPKFLKDRASLKVESLDASSPEEWENIGRKYTFTGIVHLASSPIQSGQLALVTSAVSTFSNAIDAATSWGCRLTFASTIGVYGGTSSDGPFQERTDLNLRVPYGIPASKKLMELLAAVAAAERNIEVVALRLPAIYGPLGNPLSRFFALPEFVHAAATRRAVRLPGPMFADDGLDVCYVSDVARAIAQVQLATSLQHAVYNIGSGVATTNQMSADAVYAQRPEFVLGAVLTPGASAPPTVLDISRASTDFGYAPEVPLAEGIELYLDWLSFSNSR
jgi:UDP-glucose 4-epimerase